MSSSLFRAHHSNKHFTGPPINTNSNEQYCYYLIHSVCPQKSEVMFFQFLSSIIFKI